MAAIILIAAGPYALLRRWEPVTLTLTHLMTLGFITMAMIGAMLQMMSVVAGSPAWRPRLVSTVVHSLLCLGVVALAGGFWLDYAGLMWFGLPMLAMGLIFFLATIALSLARSRVHSPTVTGMCLAVVSLTITFAFGLRIGAEHIWQFQTHVHHSWTNVHLAWALIGWVGLLVISVAYEVVPMFQLTPPYPAWMQRWLSKWMMVVLILWTGAYLLTMPGWLLTLLGLCIAAALICFAATTLYLQSHRRRRRSDVTMDFWRIGMLSLFASVLLWISGQFLPALATWPHYDLLLGTTYIAGFAVSVINGMLYKIVPFQVWFHLQSRYISQTGLPTVKEIIPDHRARWQMRFHLSALLLLAAAVVWPEWLTYAAGILFAVSFFLLAFNLFAAGRTYLQTKASLDDSTL
ncbi:MAG: hypothetical protein Q9M27_05320 [Mariprofundaceae bacterium]|nr:hypothetical protein [Mariprofundaceae bacterium]